MDELILKKRILTKSEDYQQIRKLQLDHIAKLSNASIEPLLLKGMLKLIDDTDKWEEEYKKLRPVKLL